MDVSTPHAPPGPEPGEPAPEQPVADAEARAGDRALVDGELLAEGEHLDLEVGGVRAEPGREEPEEMRKDEPHGARP